MALYGFAHTAWQDMTFTWQDLVEDTWQGYKTEHTTALGLVPSHVSTLYELHTSALGLTLSHISTLYGIHTSKLGLVLSYEGKIYHFQVDLKFYDRNDNLVKIISSKTQNFPLLNLDFEFLEQGGNGAFSLETSEDLGLDYNYRCEIYLYDTLWFSGFITKKPKIGTKQTYSYGGYGYFDQTDWQVVNETYTGQELSAIVENILDNYLVPNTDIRKA